MIGPDGFVTDIIWQENTLESGQTTQVSSSVTLEEEGVYTVKIFVWDGVGGTPKPLSEVTVKRISVNYPRLKPVGLFLLQRLRLESPQA